MTLHLHRAQRTDVLAAGLGDLLAAPLDDPFAREVVVVPAKGIERWLTQRLAHRLGAGVRGGDGVCAGVRFISPRSLVSLLLDRERDDIWDPDRMVWPLLEVIDASLDEPWCATLAVHLGHGLSGEEGLLRQNRRYSVARRIAGLFSSYAVQRPALVTDWREGRDTDGAGQTLDTDLHWQAHLWRGLIAHVDAPPPDVRHAHTLELLRAGGASLDLPPRLSLFGHTRLSITEVELLSALGETRDVHLWLPQPSLPLWDELAGIGGSVPRADDSCADRVGHPLLASLGRDARELRRTLDGVVRAGDSDLALVRAGSTGDDETLLHWLQQDLRANRAPDAAERLGRTHRAEDRSVQVHACHGPARQVDVLREVLVGLLEDDPTLEPRDILVMCPDIETFAPLISAGFGLADAVVDGGHPAHRLRVRLADRSLRSTNPLLAVAASLVELAGGRVTATDVLDLATDESVRRRFRLTDDDLARISRWVAEAGIRWGVDAAQRRGYEMNGFAHNTWRSGLDRILLGVAMSGDDHRHLGRGLPLDDVGSADIELVGRLAEFLNRLERSLDALADSGTVGEWMAALRGGVRGLTDVLLDDAWQVPQFERELARAADTSNASADGASVPLRLADVRALVQSRLGGRPTRANFRTGTLTVCTMVPMRSVPHRVVCLIGLDDGVFPRTGSIDGDDALARRPLTGERDIRSEDRQLLLDAVLAAGETLVVTYTGANEHSGALSPPAVPLGEILDAVDRTTAEPVRDHVLLRHPLQPYDARNLVAGALTSSRPFSFDVASLAGATAAAGRRRPHAPFLDGALSEHPPEDVSLADLKRFFDHPVKAFLKDRLDLAIPLSPDDISDSIPIELRGLDQWKIGDRLVGELVRGQDPSAVMTAELLRGSVPPGSLGQKEMRRIALEAQAIYNGTAHLRTGPQQSVDVDVDLGADRRLTGTVSGIYGHKIVSLGYSRLRAKQRLRSWLDLLAVSISFPDQNWTSHAVGKGRAGATCAIAGPLDHRAIDWLRGLVALYDLGHCQPLAAPIDTACAWATKEVLTRGGVGPKAYGDPVVDAWASNDQSPVPGEREDGWNTLLYGERAPIETLLDAGLATYAWQIWEPLLTGAERVAPL